MAHRSVLALLVIVGCTSSGGGPDGTYAAARTPANHNCGNWPAARTIVIDGEDITVNGIAGTAVHVDDVRLDPADESGAPNVTFTTAESETDPGVSTSTGTVSYMLWANGAALGGRADATYQTTPTGGQPASCTMTWSIEMAN
jgi:hypothetical protein